MLWIIIYDNTFFNNISYKFNKEQEIYFDPLVVYDDYWYIENTLLSSVSKKEVLKHLKSCETALSNKNILTVSDKSHNLESWSK